MKQILSPEEQKALTTLTPIEIQFEALCLKCRDNTAALANSFRDMVHFAHDAKLEPKRITLIMRSVGFADSRISEFKAIAQDPLAFKSYTTGEIGFKPALIKARETKAKKNNKKNSRKKIDKQKEIAYKALVDYTTRNPSLLSFTMELPGFVGQFIRRDSKAPFVSNINHANHKYTVTTVISEVTPN